MENEVPTLFGTEMQLFRGLTGPPCTWFFTADPWSFRIEVRVDTWVSSVLYLPIRLSERLRPGVLETFEFDGLPRASRYLESWIERSTPHLIPQLQGRELPQEAGTASQYPARMYNSKLHLAKITKAKTDEHISQAVLSRDSDAIRWARRQMREDTDRIRVESRTGEVEGYLGITKATDEGQTGVIWSYKAGAWEFIIVAESSRDYRAEVHYGAAGLVGCLSGVTVQAALNWLHAWSKNPVESLNTLKATLPSGGMKEARPTNLPWGPADGDEE